MAENENQDLQILAQKEALEKEIAESIPLVGELEDISALEAEFRHDPVFLEKVKNLGKSYTQIRRTRPDGNCFFRALAFRYFEVLLTNEAEKKRFRDEVIVPSKEEMDKLGFNSFTVSDFQENFIDAIDNLSDEASLFENFNEHGFSNYIVVFLRLLTSKHLQENEAFFQNFIEDGKTIKEFCMTDVEPMFQESDNIHVIALTATTGIKIRIMYLDRGSNSEASTHDFPEDSTPTLHILYRPGHYDILYPK